jgi:subfamily B ATP-binding cassette protein MsbA
VTSSGDSANQSRSDLWRLLSYVRPYRVKLACALLSILVGTLLGLALPQVVRIIIDASQVGGDAPTVRNGALLLLAVFVGQTLFGFLRHYLLSSMGEGVVTDLRTELYAHLTKLPMAFFASRRVGELTSRMAADVTVVQTAATNNLTEFVRQTVMLTGGLAIITIMSPRLTLLMLSVVPVIVLLGALYGRYVRRISTRVQDQLAEAVSILEETLSAIRVVQSFVREDYERTRYRARVGEARRMAIRRAIVGGAFTAAIGWVVMGGLAAVLWVGGMLVVRGELTPGAVTAFVLYAFGIGLAIGGLAQLYGAFQQAIGATRRIFEILDTQPDIRDPAHPVHVESVLGHVQFEAVDFFYPDERAVEVLSSATLDARPGQIIALVGPSGAGKSTLVSLIPRFYDVCSGRVRIDGHDVRTLSLRDLRGAVGLVPQDITLFGGTIRDNIAYGRLGASDSEIAAAARASHAHDFIVECPDGYDTIVGDRGVKLSGGQRQRIAIARALLKNPAILILDEATSSLDSASENLIQEALDTLMQGRTTFVIAHRLSTVRRADQILVLDAGRIVERGTHEELVARGGLYKDLHDIQFRDTARPSMRAASVRGEARS